MAKNPHNRIARVPIDNVTFGVEIECFLPDTTVQSLNLQLGPRHHGRPLPAPFPSDWLAEEDASLRPYPLETALEIVSPKLAGLAGLQQVEQIYQLLHQHRARVNESCGLHVHVGMRSLLGEKASDFSLVVRWVRRLINLMSVHEPALFAITGDPHRPESTYCRSIKPKWAGKLSTTDSLEMVQARNVELNEANRDVSRYYTLNVCNLFGGKCTVEFRAFAATLDPLQALGYIVTALGLCHRAAECGTSPNYDSSPPDWSRAPEFVADLHKTLWRNDHHYGWPTGAFDHYAERVLAHQQTQAIRFTTTNMPQGTSS